MNQELKVILNDDYYQKSGDSFYPSQDLESLYNNSNSITIKVQAIIRGKQDKEMVTNGSGFAYTNALTEMVVSKNKESKIVKAQLDKDYNILTSMPFDESTSKETVLGYLGCDTIPVAIYIYPKDFSSKEEITNYLDKYNEDKHRLTLPYNRKRACLQHGERAGGHSKGKGIGGNCGDRPRHGDEGRADGLAFFKPEGDSGIYKRCENVARL